MRTYQRRAGLLLLMVVIAFACRAGFADPPAANLPPEGPEKSAVEVDAATADAPELYDRRFRYLSIRDLTLEQAVELIRRATHANFVVEMWRLEKAGYDPKRTIRLYLEDVPWDVALAAMLSAYGRDVPVELGERNDRQILVISTPEGASRSVMRIYDIRQIVEYVQSGEAGRPLGPRGEPEEIGHKTEVVESIFSMLMEMVDADTWRDNGGNDGAIRVLASRLIITQTPRAHQRIERILKDLEQELSRPMPAPAATRPAATRPSAGAKP